MSGFCLCSVLLLMVSCAFSSKTCRNYLEEAGDVKYDIVIVPGVPFENGQWNNIMKGRIYWSKYLYDNGITENVMYSGSAVSTPYVEAVIMALYAEKLGIRKENIFTETLAEHSTENIHYGYLMARKLGFERIALASDAFQTKMLKRYTQKVVSSEVDFIPMVIDTLEAMQSLMTDPEIDYQKAFVESFVPLNERENFRQRFKGTRGHNVDTSAYR
ncbi:MAG: YdcF family protein [Bacteroidales bacterium]|nr:YdcF family protein [Bacteroidales bacterium]